MDQTHYEKIYNDIYLGGEPAVEEPEEPEDPDVQTFIAGEDITRGFVSMGEDGKVYQGILKEPEPEPEPEGTDCRHPAGYRRIYRNEQMRRWESFCDICDKVFDEGDDDARTRRGQNWLTCPHPKWAQKTSYNESNKSTEIKCSCCDEVFCSTRPLKSSRSSACKHLAVEGSSNQDTGDIMEKCHGCGKVFFMTYKIDNSARSRQEQVRRVKEEKEL